MPRRSLPVLALALALAAPATARAGGGATVVQRPAPGATRWTQKARPAQIRRTLLRPLDRNRGARLMARAPGRLRATGQRLLDAGAALSDLPGILEHVSLGMPSDASVDDPADHLLVQRGYVTSYNRQRKTPNWVATKLTRSDVTGPFNRRLKFKRNQKLPEEWDPAGPSDYKGAFASARLTRGHLVGSGDQTGDAESHADTYLMTNQVPQLYDNNAGPWHDFETHLREAALHQDVYIFAGGIFDADPPTIGQNEVAVPKATWKVAVTVPRGAAFDSPQARAMYLIVPNEPGKVSLEQTFERYLVGGHELERATGLRFFTGQDEAVREKFLSSTYRPRVPTHYYSRRKIAEIRRLGLELPASVRLDPRERTVPEKVKSLLRPTAPAPAAPARFFQP